MLRSKFLRVDYLRYLGQSSNVGCFNFNVSHTASSGFQFFLFFSVVFPFCSFSLSFCCRFPLFLFLSLFFFLFWFCFVLFFLLFFLLFFANLFFVLSQRLFLSFSLSLYLFFFSFFLSVSFFWFLYLYKTTVWWFLLFLWVKTTNYSPDPTRSHPDSNGLFHSLR